MLWGVQDISVTLTMNDARRLTSTGRRLLPYYPAEIDIFHIFSVGFTLTRLTAAHPGTPARLIWHAVC